MVYSLQNHSSSGKCRQGHVGGPGSSGIHGVYKWEKAQRLPQADMLVLGSQGATGTEILNIEKAEPWCLREEMIVMCRHSN